MTTRIACLPGPAAFLFLLVPIAASATDEDAAIDQAADATSELIAYTRVLFECDMLIDTIERSPIEHPEMDLFFVTLKAEGIECERAFDVLNHRGRNKGLYFSLPKDDATDGERPAGTNLGLIHEIDPEVESEEDR